ncbi:MAG: hypothetical protein CVV27_07010 [Candidatus Melainabacteria bacterium HGW-Melainabacteria-1]|nr:MAG: hypothetical protein CVV27_07010 [Candidatus Melainabacteria bacterium HGW-Melainabacteria-1]
MNPTLVKGLQIVAILFVGLIALNVLTSLVFGTVQLLFKLGLLLGLCLLVFYVVAQFKKA